MAAYWWKSELAHEEDPISLEPLRKLRYPPFRLRADPELPHWVSADWFDGRVLASYLVSTGRFAHPISRRELARNECAALDAYLREHQLGDAHVELVWRHVHGTTRSASQQPQQPQQSQQSQPPPAASQVARLRAEAAVVLGNLFGGAAPTPSRAASGEAAAAARDGNLTMVDDDLRPSQQPLTADELAAPREAFPMLPVSANSTASAADANARQASSASGGSAASNLWQGANERVLAAASPPPPPPPPPVVSEEERERRGRARLLKERAEWAAAVRRAEAKASAERDREEVCTSDWL